MPRIGRRPGEKPMASLLSTMTTVIGRLPERVKVEIYRMADAAPERGMSVIVDGVSHVFSIIAVHKPSGLYQSIETVRGATVKAGWIVLANGTQVGSLEPDSTSATPSAQTAPKLDISTLTAQDGDTTLTATPIDGETGSGF